MIILKKLGFIFLQEKSKAFCAFKTFQARAENKIGKNIKTFFTNYGGEYCSKEFEGFYDANGIHKGLIAAYILQQK